MTQTQTTALHSPQNLTPGMQIHLSHQGKVWRKQILPLGSINYRGRQIKFDSQYHKDLVRNFRAGAYSQVPFQLADASNTHTNDPERTRGELVDLRAEPSGLYGYFKLNDPSVVLNNQNLGVSCRILENYTREHDGRKFGRALQHVLGTLDPRITGMKPWESVELSSAQADETIDLSGQFYTKDGGAMPEQNEDKVVVELSTAQMERLNAMLAADEEDEDEGAENGTDGLFDDLDPKDFTDDPGEDGEDQQDDTEGEDEDEDSLGDQVQLATMRQLQGQVLELTNKLVGQEIEHEIEQLAATGLAPAIIEAARPLLVIQSGVVELSNGHQVSPSKATRKLLRTILELANRGVDVVSFDLERGSLGGADSASAVRDQTVDEMDRIYGS